MPDLNDGSLQNICGPGMRNHMQISGATRDLMSLASFLFRHQTGRQAGRVVSDDRLVLAVVRHSHHAKYGSYRYIDIRPGIIA